MELLLVLFLVYALVFGFFCAYLAGEKGRSGGAWFFLGLIFGILALLVLIGLPSEQGSSNEALRVSTRSTISSGSRSPSGRQGSDIRLCPHCIQEVHELATACPHCQRDLPEVERCSYEPCHKIINPTDDRCEDEEGNVFCKNLHRQRPAPVRRDEPVQHDEPVQCDECGGTVFKSYWAAHRQQYHRNPKESDSGKFQC